MSLDGSDEEERTEELGKKWARSKRRMIKLEDEAIVKTAQQLKIREDMGEDLTDNDRLLMRIGRRIERRRQLEASRQARKKPSEEVEQEGSEE
jgi:hypothetical protein